MELLNVILEEIKDVISKVNESEFKSAASAITKKRRIFVDGEGRSGLMAKGFAMRLMHLGYNVYVVGETITPSVRKGDLFISVSGSGKSANVVSDTKKAKKAGCEIVSFTSNKESDLAKESDIIVVVPGTVKGDTGLERKSIQLLSSLFDQSIHIVLDGLCLYLSKRDDISNESATKIHW
ncbi:6-phospho-3-hexuloisomerase [Clostridium nigeriense]|uniref:6-phospho-3-hexuloisomerase n=1 Tax=Clostridium nigeriense TaxID=1805470 RepID=UPI003D336626